MEMTKGRGPDRCIDAVGAEAHAGGQPRRGARQGEGGGRPGHRPAARPPRGDHVLPQGRHGLDPRRLHRLPRQDPDGRRDEQGPDLQDGPDPRPALHRAAPEEDRRPARSTPRSSSPTRSRSRKAPRPTRRSATRRTAASRSSSSPEPRRGHPGKWERISTKTRWSVSRDLSGYRPEARSEGMGLKTFACIQACVGSDREFAATDHENPDTRPIRRHPGGRTAAIESLISPNHPGMETDPTRRTNMERHRFGPDDRDVSVIGQGTWYIDSGDRGSAVAALRRGLDLGMNHIDTAEMYGDAEDRGRRGDRRAARRGVPGLQGAPAERLAERDGRGLRAVTCPPGDRPARLLPPALARRVPAGGHVRRLRATPGRGEDPLLGREQLRRGRPRRGPGDRRRGADRLQSGALPPGGARHRARRAPLVRGARRRRGRLQPVWSRRLPGPHSKGGRACGRSPTRTTRRRARSR